MDLYKDYVASMQKLADVNYAIAVLQWDKEVYLPKKGAAFRSRQIATLAGIGHEIFIDKKLGDILQKLDEQKENLSPQQAKNIELTLRDYNRFKKYSTDFIIQKSKTTSKAYHAWVKARKENDYHIYKPALREVVEMSRKEAELLGYEAHPYDALVDLYEPKMTSAILDKLFKDVREQLVHFVKDLHQKTQVASDFLRKHYDKDKQWKYGLDILKKMGYDFDAGRQDISLHPFTVNFNPNDVRVTTRIDENDFGNMTWSCIHEGGHALYEQGLPTEEYGLHTGKHISLGIHESQSRLWENNVGRSLPFWKSEYNNLQTLFPENLKEISVTQFYKGINRIAPNFIRTEADELHYHFHVLIRYEIEKGLMEGSLEVDELDQVWNQKYKEYMNVDVPDDKNGILQDIHWAHGSIGYFPTYSLGSFYAAQFFHQAQKDLPNLIEEIEQGNSASLLAWLREKVHRHGRLYGAEELCERITGEPLNFKYFMDYAKVKYDGIYG